MKNPLFSTILSALRKKVIPESIKGSNNNDIDEMNTFSGSADNILKLFRKKQTGILKTP